MPNVNSPNGFTPIKQRNNTPAPSPNAYQIAGALASNIFRGSAVIPVGTNKRINVAAAGNRVIGVFAGCNYVDAAGDVQIGRPRWISGQTIKTGSVVDAFVYDDPTTLFEGQVSGAAGLAAGDEGGFADIVVGVGDAASGNSRDMIDQTTITSTDATGGQVRIEELRKIINNDYGQYAKCLFRWNEHFHGSAVATANTTAI
jgi:hypothetical protein